MNKTYNNIAQIYDLFKWYQYSLDLFDEFLPYLKKYKIKNHLDLACGTGKLVDYIEKKLKTESFGSDISFGMITEAQRNFWENKFWVEDMTNIKTNIKYDLITCLYDNLNHLDSLDSICKVFTGVYSSLKSQWIFVFDIQTNRYLKNWERDCQWEDKGYKIHNIGKIYPKENKAICEISVQKINNSSDNFSLFFQGKLWSLWDIISNLNLSWFKNIQIIWDSNKYQKNLIIAHKKVI